MKNRTKLGTALIETALTGDPGHHQETMTVVIKVEVLGEDQKKVKEIFPLWLSNVKTRGKIFQSLWPSQNYI